MNSTNFIEPTILVKNSGMTTIESWFIPLDILMIVCVSFGIIFGLIFLFIIIFDKTCRTVPMIHVVNSCLGEILFANDLLGMAIFTLQNDLKQIQFQDSLCVFRGYISYVSCTVLNSSFLLQAINRYIIVIYPNRLFYQSRRFQVLLIGITWIYAFAYPIPFTFTHDIIYNVDNQICQLPLQLSFLVIYMILCAYAIPVSVIMFIYLKLVRHVHKMSKRVTPVNTLSRAQRELKMVRRTVILVTILFTTGFPYTLFILISFFNRLPKYHFRIAYIFINVSMVFVMIALFQFTDPLKTSIMNKIKRPSNTVVTRVEINE